MRLRTRGRRSYVVARAKVRGQRMRQAGAAAALLFLGAAAFLTMRHVGRFSQGLVRAAASRPASRSFSVEGLPADAAAAVQAALAASPAGSDADAAKDALARLPYLKELHCQADWTGRRSICAGSLRLAVAAVFGRPRVFIDEQGAVFEAPAWYAGVAGPLVEPGRADAAELESLAGFLSKDAAGLPSPAQRLTYVSPQDGWRIALQDGTTLLFGNMRWTDQKVRRLGQVMADARSEFSSRQFTADLRYFEDGRILLRPLPKAGAR